MSSFHRVTLLYLDFQTFPNQSVISMIQSFQMKEEGQIYSFGLNYASLGTAFLFSTMIIMKLPQTYVFSLMQLPLQVSEAYFRTKWFADSWPNEINLPSDLQSTALLELYSMLQQLQLFFKRKMWGRKQIIVFCDNATVNIINKRRSSVPFINKLIILPGHAYCNLHISSLNYVVCHPL